MPRIQIHRLETIEACTHEVAIPPGMEYVPLVVTGAKPPKEYPFILDPFQKEALLCVENNQSVLVSAHTSAGKTVVAEWADAFLTVDFVLKNLWHQLLSYLFWIFFTSCDRHLSLW